MSRKTFHELLSRYLEGNCTEEEKRTVEHWYGLLDHEDLSQIEKTQLDVIEIKLWNKIISKSKIELADEVESTYRRGKVAPMWLKLTVAASISLLILFSLYSLLNSKTNGPTFLSIKKTEKNILEKVNRTGQPLKILLEDGSEVTLQPGSGLTYPKAFTKDKREVVLTGEALFEIAMDKNRPFYVYNGNIVTQVVGTSFTVKTDPVHKFSEVAVLTGKVIVFENLNSKGLYKKLFSKDEKKAVLTPNERAIYYYETEELIATLVEEPKPLEAENKENVTQTNFVYNDTPVSSVLEELEKNFGIKIISENPEIFNCTFTGDLNEQDMYSMLDFVCVAIGATYEIRETKIFIKGKGCK